MPRPQGTTALAISATVGGMLGLLAGILELPPHLEVGGWGLVVILIISMASVAELAFALGTWMQMPWALKRGPRTVGFAGAVALLLLGLYDVVARLANA